MLDHLIEPDADYFDDYLFPVMKEEAVDKAVKNFKLKFNTSATHAYELLQDLAKGYVAIEDQRECVEDCIWRKLDLGIMNAYAILDMDDEFQKMLEEQYDNRDED